MVLSSMQPSKVPTSAPNRAPRRQEREQLSPPAKRFALTPGTNPTVGDAAPGVVPLKEAAKRHTLEKAAGLPQAGP